MDQSKNDLSFLSYFVAAICRTNSNQFEFVRQIAVTKFCRSDNDFHMSHEAICCSNLSRRRVAAICRIVCLGLKCLLILSNVPQHHKLDISCMRHFSRKRYCFTVFKSISQQRIFFFCVVLKIWGIQNF